jgi:hypothetical protein
LADADKIENPQLMNMFNQHLWDGYRMVLDNCKKPNGSYNFSKVDPSFNDINQHPLMLIARSGQESLMNHPTTQKLLSLKWRYIPRCAYYSNLLLYMTFLITFSIYTVKLTNIGFPAAATKLSNNENHTKLSANIGTSSDSFNFTLPDDFTVDRLFDKALSILLLVIVFINFSKQFLRFLLIDRLLFFLNFENWLEMIVSALVLVTLFSTSFYVKSAYASVTILFAYLRFVFLLQKLRIFGIYVLAFRRTLQNSAKFFVIFLVVLIGFGLSFHVRSNFGYGYFDSFSTLMVKTIGMFVGDLKSDSIDFNSSQSATNTILYLLFMALMTLIMLNLFVGIAVGEINKVLDEAVIQQTSLRIVFVLKVQQALKVFNRIICKPNFFNMKFTEYNYEKEYKIVKLKDSIVNFIERIFATQKVQIQLIDPQKRLEENINDLGKATVNEFSSFKDIFNVQLLKVFTILLYKI